jgi:hypothetical protein
MISHQRDDAIERLLCLRTSVRIRFDNACEEDTMRKDLARRESNQWNMISLRVFHISVILIEETRLWTVWS